MGRSIDDARRGRNSGFIIAGLIFQLMLLSKLIDSYLVSASSLCSVQSRRLLRLTVPFPPILYTPLLLHHLHCPPFRSRHLGGVPGELEVGAAQLINLRPLCLAQRPPLHPLPVLLDPSCTHALGDHGDTLVQRPPACAHRHQHKRGHRVNGRDPSRSGFPNLDNPRVALSKLSSWSCIHARQHVSRVLRLHHASRIGTDTTCHIR